MSKNFSGVFYGFSELQVAGCQCFGPGFASSGNKLAPGSHLFDADVPVGTIYATALVFGSFRVIILLDNAFDVAGSPAYYCYVVVAYRHFYQLVAAAGIDEVASVDVLAEVFPDQPGVTVELGFVGVVYFVFVAGEFVIQRCHGAVFEPQDFVDFAAQPLVAEVLVEFFVYCPDALAEVRYVLPCALYM